MTTTRAALLAVMIGGLAVVAGCKEQGTREKTGATTQPSTMPAEIPPTTQGALTPTTPGEGAMPRTGGSTTEPVR